MGEIVWKKLVAGLAVFGAVLGIGAGLFFWLGGGEDGAVDEAPGLPSRLHGKWLVTYEDSVLGEVSGSAFIDETGTSATVQLWDPKQPNHRVPYELKSSSISLDGADATIVLHGTSPHAERFDPLAEPDEKPTVLGIEAGTSSLTASMGELSASVPVLKIGDADTDRVVLSMRLDRDGNLSGAWSYFADAQTERDGSGRGRIGSFERHDSADELIGIQRGPEVWEKLEPHIVGVEVLSGPMGDQYSHFNRFDSLGRALFIYGANLPSNDEGPRLDWEGSNIKYEVPSAAVLNHSRDLVKRGWKAAEARIPSSAHDDLHKLDFVVLFVEFDKTVRPGPKQLRLSGAPVSWVLEYKDNKATVSFIRELADPDEEAPTGEVESTTNLYVPETIQVEVRTDIELPGTNGIPIIIGKNSSLVDGPDGTKTWLATRSEDPKIYRTEKIGFVDKLGGEGLELAVVSGDTLVARVTEESLFEVRGGNDLWHARAGVFRSPASQTNSDEPSVLWNEAVDRAKRCGFDEPTVSGAKVRPSDHAAMLLLADEFIRLMTDALDRVPEIRTEKERLAFRRVFGSQASDPSHPFAYLKVALPNGDEVPYARALAEDLSSSWYLRTFSDAEEAKAWADKGLGEGLASYRSSIEDAIKRTQAARDCKLDELVEITGFGFDAVAAGLMSRLVKLKTFTSPQRKTWVPDKVARGAVRGVSGLAKEVTANDNLTEIQIHFALAAATVAVALPALFVQAAWLSVAIVAVDATDVVATGYLEGKKYLKSQREIGFAFASMEVTGGERYREALDRETTLSEALLYTGVTALGAGLGASDAVAKIHRGRAATAIKKLREGGLDAIDSLSPSELRSMKRFLEEAKNLDPATLSRGQREALEFAQRLKQRRTPIDLLTTVRNKLPKPQAIGVPSRLKSADAALTKRLPDDLRDRTAVYIDPALGKSKTVEVSYEMVNGLVTNVHIRAGARASAEDIALHANTARNMKKYAGMSGRARKLRGQVDDWIGKHGRPKPGTKAWEAKLEVEKLPSVIEQRLRELRRAPDGSEMARAIGADIADLESQLQRHRRTFAALDSNPGIGKVAAKHTPTAPTVSAKLTKKEKALNHKKIDEAETIMDNFAKRKIFSKPPYSNQNVTLHGLGKNAYVRSGRTGFDGIAENAKKGEIVIIENKHKSKLYKSNQEQAFVGDWLAANREASILNTTKSRGKQLSDEWIARNAMIMVKRSLDPAGAHKGRKLNKTQRAELKRLGLKILRHLDEGKLKREVHVMTTEGNYFITRDPEIIAKLAGEGKGWKKRVNKKVREFLEADDDVRRNLNATHEIW